ncbi:hypothetical protein [Paenibacillus qinlingensis]|uniref:hypothetical protein n=1 Tax=Paenibacillus qinlingensis TaxID=1837343 RepID=UPI0015637EFD|nr:hypothetical protein [Paenibacillus qinlingensis]NQX62201.1 hypothetical protein [Paenibacillus qinlingensis]
MFTLKRKDIVFTFVFICLYSLCFCFLIYTDKQEKFHELSNELYTNHHAVLMNKDDDQDLLTTNQLSKANYRIFIEYNDTYRLLYENLGDWSPPIISGRFFSNTDKGAKAVIGKEMEKFIKEYNGKKYITFQGEDFEVNGIMGAPFASSTDYLILLYKPNPIPIQSGTRIIIDSDKKSIVTEIANNILNTNSSVMLKESTQKGLSRTANIPFIYKLLIFEFYLLLFLSIIACLRYWYEKEKHIMYVLFLLGFSKRKINGQLFLKVFLNIVASGCITVTLFLISDSKSIILLKQMVWIIILFISSACLSLGIFLRSSNSNRGVNRL